MFNKNMSFVLIALCLFVTLHGADQQEQEWVQYLADDVKPEAKPVTRPVPIVKIKIEPQETSEVQESSSSSPFAIAGSAANSSIAASAAAAHAASSSSSSAAAVLKVEPKSDFVISNIQILPLLSMQKKQDMILYHRAENFKSLVAGLKTQGIGEDILAPLRKAYEQRGSYMVRKDFLVQEMFNGNVAHAKESLRTYFLNATHVGLAQELDADKKHKRAEMSYIVTHLMERGVSVGELERIVSLYNQRENCLSDSIKLACLRLVVLQQQTAQLVAPQVGNCASAAAASAAQDASSSSSSSSSSKRSVGAAPSSIKPKVKKPRKK